MMTWTCVTRPDTLIRIGQVDFFDSTPENCLVSDKHAVAMWKPAERSTLTVLHALCTCSCTAQRRL